MAWRRGVLAVALAALAPGGASAQIQFRLESQALRGGRAQVPGDILLVLVHDYDGQGAPEGSFLGRTLDFFPACAPGTEGTYLAFAGIDMRDPPGTHTLRVTWEKKDGAADARDLSVEIRPKDFGTQFVGGLKAKQVRTRNRYDQDQAWIEKLWLKSKLPGLSSPKRHFRGSFRPPLGGRWSRLSLEKQQASLHNFGEGRVLNEIPGDPHAGADILADRGEPVLASQEGRVVRAAPFYYQGNLVILDHGFGLFTLYQHLDAIESGLRTPGLPHFVIPKDLPEEQVLARVAELDAAPWEARELAAGAPLGAVGMTGRATGPHLHWAVKWKDARINPASLLALDLDRWVGGCPGDARQQR